MNLSSYPLDLFAWALLILTVLMSVLIATSKQIVSRQKYLALSATFFVAGTLGLIEMYSQLLSIGVCLSMTALFSILFFKTGRERFQTAPLTTAVSGNSLYQSREVTADLLPDSDPRPLPGVRVISGR